jgi:hypothetical protein
MSENPNAQKRNIQKQKCPKNKNETKMFKKQNVQKQK